MNAQQFTTVSGYATQLTQDAVLFPLLTAEEILLYNQGIMHISISEELSTYVMQMRTKYTTLTVLLGRFSTNIFRTTELFVAKVIQAIHVRLVFGTILMSATHDSRKFKLQNQIGFFATSLTF